MENEKTVHDLTKSQTVKIGASISHTELSDWIDAGDRILGFSGHVEVPVSMIDNKVPSAFPNNLTPELEEFNHLGYRIEFDEETGEEVKIAVETIKERPVLDENGEVVMVKKEWGDYTSVTYSLDGATALLAIGYRDDNKNLCHTVGDVELRAWVTKFGIENVLTKSEGVALLNSSKYRKVEEETI